MDSHSRNAFFEICQTALAVPDEEKGHVVCPLTTAVTLLPLFSHYNYFDKPVAYAVRPHRGALRLTLKALKVRRIDPARFEECLTYGTVSLSWLAKVLCACKPYIKYKHELRGRMPSSAVCVFTLLQTHAC